MTPETFSRDFVGFCGIQWEIFHSVAASWCVFSREKSCRETFAVLGHFRVFLGCFLQMK